MEFFLAMRRGHAAHFSSAFRSLPGGVNSVRVVSLCSKGWRSILRLALKGLPFELKAGPWFPVGTPLEEVQQNNRSERLSKIDYPCEFLIKKGIP